MERFRQTERDRLRTPGDDSAGDGVPDNSLDEHRQEIDALLRTSDHVFDAINNAHAQQYLQQNLQTGGQ